MEPMMRSALVLMMIPLVACAQILRPSTTPAPPVPKEVAQTNAAATCAKELPVLTPAERIAKHGSVLDAYHRQDGVWLPHAPVLVNEDFDFAQAMAMEDGIGAGLAAMKRQQNNQERAEQMRDLQFDAELNERIEQLRCCGMDVYFLLWGEEGKVQMVLDVEGADNANSRVVEGTGPKFAAAAAELLARVSCGS
jgi:hypothetical protein